MKILVLNYEFPPLGGGASPVSFELAKAYAEKGHDVDVVTMGFRGLPEYENKDGLNIYRVKCPRKKRESSTGIEMFFYILSAIHFLRKKHTKYDLCHCHFLIPTGIVALWLKKQKKVPYIITSHGSDVPGYNPDRFRLMHYFTKGMLKTICRNAKAITAPSRYLAGLITQNIGKYDINIIPNGSADFCTGAKKENIIFSSGRLLPRKGFQYLIKAFDSLALSGWKLYIAGDGPYAGQLKKITSNKNIIFTGWLNNSEPYYRELLNKSKIFCLLSTNESQGIAYIEAMSAGCAIISSDLSASRETVTDDIGYRVIYNDIDQIKSKIRALAEDKKALSGFMVMSRKRFEKYFTYPTIIRKYLKLIRL